MTKETKKPPANGISNIRYYYKLDIRIVEFMQNKEGDIIFNNH